MFEYVKDAGLNFKRAVTKRTATRGIVLHHLAGWGSVFEVNEQEKRAHADWLGIGYNLYVRLDGGVWLGRGFDAVGSHAGRTVKDAQWEAGAGNNSETVGIGFEGYYHPAQTGITPNVQMPGVQFDAGVRLIRDLIAHYTSIEYVRGHKQMPATATACPGDYFPLEEMIAAAYEPATAAAAEGRPVLRKGSKGEAVICMQALLLKKGFELPRYGADGSFGDETQSAVIALQMAAGITADGVCGPRTWAALEAELDYAQAMPTLKRGDRGDWVKRLQRRLLDRGIPLSKYGADGLFGEETAQAVILFQTMHGLVADGIAGPKTWDKLITEGGDCIG